MKKLHVSSVSILFAALCLAFTACNQGIIAGNETGTVQVVIGGGGRAVDAAGMPVFDDTNTKITVTDENGNKLAEGTTSVTVNADIGTKITVKAVVTTKAGTWRGSVEHTVTAGTNIVAVRLSKTPKNMGNILSSVISQTPYGDAKVTFKLASGKELLNDVDIGSNHIIPVIARDGIGRIYVLYDKGGRHFTRFDAEGKKDNGFETAITALLPPAGTPTSPAMITMTVDPKTNTIFLINRAKQVYALKETGHNTFTCSNSVNLATLPDIKTNDEITAMAAYNGELFLTVRRDRHPPVPKPNKLFACTAELSGTALTLTEKGTAELDELRTSAVMNVPTECTGLFADASGVYCLLREQRLDGGMLYMVGALVCYSRDDNTVTYLKKHSKAAGTDLSLAFEPASFANPVGFIGSDEENIYIADDGYNIEYLNENWRTNGNKNRIAAFNRNTNEITFTDTEATWYGQKSEYKFPETPVLLWERDTSTPPAYNGVRYWVSTDGTSPAPAETAKIYQTAVSSNEIMDVFCYDQEGNLYVLWKEGTNYCIQRFEFKDNSYDFTQGVKLNLGSIPQPNAIAVDVSDGQNYLYYNSSPQTIQRYTWTSPYFQYAYTTGYNITLPSVEKVTALAANKDGVFIATKEQETHPVVAPYTLKIKKYTKDTGTSVGEKAIATHEGGDEAHTPPASYKNNDGTVNSLQIVNGVLYAITSKITKTMKNNGTYVPDEFRSNGILYKVGNTEGSFSGTASELGKKEADDVAKTGYGFYRFIAVKPKKLVIASDSAWGQKGTETPFDKEDTDTVLEYDLAGVLGNPKNAGGTFSQQLLRTSTGCGFSWK